MALIKLSPIAETLGVQECQLTDDVYVVTAVPAGDYKNSTGRISGGFLATLLDDTMARYLAHVLGIQSIMTLSLAVQYLDAAYAGGTLTVSVHISRTGDKISYAKGTIEHEGKVVAQAIGTFGHAGPRFRNTEMYSGEDHQRAPAAGQNT